MTDQIGNKELAEKVATAIGDENVTPKLTGAVIKETFETIGKEVSAGNTVAIAGFGKYSPVDKPARKGRNPSTGKEIDIAAARVVKFKVSSRLKKIVAGE